LRLSGEAFSSFIFPFYFSLFYFLFFSFLPFFFFSLFELIFPAIILKFSTGSLFY